MCGIVGYAGNESAAPILLQGLSKLEYRGYDSAGICVQHGKTFTVIKTKGKVAALCEKCRREAVISGHTGIAHTRWATHGAPSDINSHPHLSNDGNIALVHNGIIENEAVLRKWLLQEGYTFKSQTDTEVVANLISFHYEKNGVFDEAVRQALACIEGNYAFVIMCKKEPGVLIGAKKGSPLIVGFSPMANYIASDISALLSHTNRFAQLSNGEMVVLSEKEVCFYDADGESISVKTERISFDEEASKLGEYPNYMFKEIFEQPKAVKATIDSWRELKIPRNIAKLYFVACGSACYVGLVAKYLVEAFCEVSAEAIVSSEFRYAMPKLNGDSLVVVISQSGETADTLAALRAAKQKGANTLAIVNVRESAIAKDADQVFYTNAGQEVAVATTKAFSAQLSAVYLLLASLGCKSFVDAARNLPSIIREFLNDELCQKCEELALQYYNCKSVYYIGRKYDYAIAMEGSLKLKEVAYIHSEAYPAGELKHGPIAMIEEGTLVVALATVDALFQKTMANIQEVKARGAKVICITTRAHEEEALLIADQVIAIPSVSEPLRGNLSVIPLQLFAYYVAQNLGRDIDKPRNLAKSVTVE